jgi:hypothetical protein
MLVEDTSEDEVESSEDRAGGRASLRRVLAEVLSGFFLLVTGVGGIFLGILVVISFALFLLGALILSLVDIGW